MAGMTIYLTEEEISALRNTSTEWCEIMGTADDVSLVEERMNEGLGSALKKLYKGTNGERVYRNY